MTGKLSPGVAKVLKRLHYPLDVMLLCVRWYVAYPLSLRHLEQMMAERGIAVDHSTVHRWALKLFPGPGEGVSTAQTDGQQELEDGRDLHSNQG
ncbi:transposase-like protein [Paraburkholderia youngii]